MILTAEELTTPTELCRLMEKWGSDKGRENITMWKHNYTVVYTKLFAGLRDKPIRIFELGLGTNNVYLASTMAGNGVPGASLRAWEEYFPSAAVFGADIDRDILFAEGRIKTYFCDQTSPDAIRTLWSEGDLSEGFDIIVEDGLHTFDANVCFFENSVHKLRAGGIYIIEDITRPDLSRFEEKLVAWRRQFPGFTFELIDIPCTVNQYDNIILVITGHVDLDKEAAARYVIEHDVEGVLVECGVATGNTPAAWITELVRLGAEREIHMYDTFTGLTEPSEHDYTCADGPWQMSNEEVVNYWRAQKINTTTNNWCYTPLETVQNRLAATGYGKLEYIVGDVMQTLADDANIPEKIAVLRLDTDWYESTAFELERLYEKVVVGGLIIFDDYYLWAGQRKAADEFFKRVGIVPRCMRVNEQTMVMIK